MGNVHASQKDPPSNRVPSSIPLPPLQPEIIKSDVSHSAPKNVENPGTVEDLHKKCKELFPMPFDGARLVVNKGLSNHFQISHSLHLTSGPSSGYKFGATYVGTNQVSSTEAYPVLLGDMDPNGNLNANIILQPTNNSRFKFQAQSQNSKFQLTQFSLDYRGSRYTSSIMAANPNILNATGIYIVHHLYQITPSLSLGFELLHQRLGHQLDHVPSLIASFAGKYTGEDYSLSATAGMTGFHVCYYQKASEQLQLGVELEINARMREAQASIGYQVDIPKADIVFKGMVDTNWTVSTSLEKKMNPMPFSLALTGLLNHRKNDFRLGLGFIIG